MRTFLRIAALVPAAALVGTLPATAQTTSSTTTVHAASVASRTAPNAAPLKALRSSSVSCTGTLMYRGIARSGKTVVGELDVYGRTSAGGTVVACFRHAGATAHKRLPTSVGIVAAKTPKATKPAVVVLAEGNFISWAGPVAVAGVKGNCFQAAGAVKYMGKAVTVQSPAVCTK